MIKNNDMRLLIADLILERLICNHMNNIYCRAIGAIGISDEIKIKGHFEADTQTSYVIDGKRYDAPLEPYTEATPSLRMSHINSILSKIKQWVAEDHELELTWDLCEAADVIDIKWEATT